MEGHELGTHIDKMYADSSTGTTPTTPQSIQPFFPNLPIIWDIFKKQALITCPLSMEKDILRRFAWIKTMKCDIDSQQI